MNSQSVANNSASTVSTVVVSKESTPAVELAEAVVPQAGPSASASACLAPYVKRTGAPIRRENQPLRQYLQAPRLSTSPDASSQTPKISKVPHNVIQKDSDNGTPRTHRPARMVRRPRNFMLGDAEFNILEQYLSVSTGSDVETEDIDIRRPAPGAPLRRNTTKSAKYVTKPLNFNA